jgi:uncharacterized OsmC-like protein
VTDNGTGPEAVPVPRRRVLTASNDGGMRTVACTGDGLTLVTDEPTGRGGTGTAPTPLETVIGALCGCTAVTFAEAAREQGFRYDRIGFEVRFMLVPRGIPGDPVAKPRFGTVRVRARVATAEAAGRLREVAEITERRCPVRNLLGDAGVATEVTWTAILP